MTNVTTEPSSFDHMEIVAPHSSSLRALVHYFTFLLWYALHLSSEDCSVMTNVTTEPSSLGHVEALVKHSSSLRDLVAQSSSSDYWIVIQHFCCGVFCMCPVKMDPWWCGTSLLIHFHCIIWLAEGAYWTMRVTLTILLWSISGRVVGLLRWTACICAYDPLCLFDFWCIPDLAGNACPGLSLWKLHFKEITHGMLCLPGRGLHQKPKRRIRMFHRRLANAAQQRERPLNLISDEIGSDSF